MDTPLTVSSFILVLLALRLTPVCSPDVRRLVTTGVGVHEFCRLNIGRKGHCIIKAQSAYRIAGTGQYAYKSQRVDQVFHPRSMQANSLLTAPAIQRVPTRPKILAVLDSDTFGKQIPPE